MVNEFLSEAGRDVIESLAEETKEIVEKALTGLAKEHSIIDGTLEVVNMGNRVNPSLWLGISNTEIGSLNIENGRAVINLDPVLQDVIAFTRDTKANLEQFMEDQGEPTNPGKVTELMNMISPAPTTSLKESAKEILTEALETGPHDSVTDITKNVMDDINKSLSDAGVENPYKKMQDKIISNLEREDKKDHNILKQRHTMKQELSNIQAEIKALYADIQKETTIAQKRGMTQEDVDKINNKATQIKEMTLKAAEIIDEMPSMKKAILDTIKDKSRLVQQQVQGRIDRAVAGYNAKIQAVKNALTGIKNEVHLANERALTGKDTLYTGVVERVEQIHRDWMSVNYSVDKSIVSALDKTRDMLEKNYSRVAEIKGAFKDLGRAFTGKERTGERTEYTPNQQAVLNFLNGRSNEIKQEMAELNKSYSISLAATQYNLKSVQERRESVGLSKSMSLEERMKEARERSIEGKKQRDMQSPAKNEPSRNGGDR